MAGRSFSSQRLNGWTRAHPVLWSAVIGLVFATASYLASAAFGARDVTTLEADIAGGVTFGLVTWITTRLRIRSRRRTPR